MTFNSYSSYFRFPVLFPEQRSLQIFNCLGHFKHVCDDNDDDDDDDDDEPSDRQAE